MHDEEFRRAIEQIKLRAPIEDVVRERVPGLKKSGAAWMACCPFHEERTPSFRVDPRRGTWHCFGACGTGGDQISFLERFENLSFMDALEILAGRTGVDLPRRRSPADEGAGRADREREDATRAMLDLAIGFYREQIATPEGARAARYLAERGLSLETAEAFGIGYAPASGQAFVQRLRDQRLDVAVAEAAGLVRHSDQGRPYDFFRGRLVIPIRDAKGNAVGFGARRLDDDDASGPKYVNTSETTVFKKGRLVYALDRAIAEVRKSGHIALVEGYTDVMAAHQAGIRNVVAVLGTATTEDHAAAIRRTGARRVTLVFDGDEAGRKATWRSLAGLLPLEVEIDVVALQGGIDPCDLLVEGGAAAFRAQLELARGWFEFAVDGLRGLSGSALSREVDQVLELLSRLRKPVHRESLIRDLAARLDLPAASLREQMRPERPPAPSPRAGPIVRLVVPLADARTRAAWREMVGALLADPSLLPLARPLVARCPDPDLAAVLNALLDLDADESVDVDAAGVMNVLLGHTARELVVPLVDDARAADSPRVQLEGALQCIARIEAETAALERESALREVEREAGEVAVSHPRALEIARAADQTMERTRR